MDRRLRSGAGARNLGLTEAAPVNFGDDPFQHRRVLYINALLRNTPSYCNRLQNSLVNTKKKAGPAEVLLALMESRGPRTAPELARLTGVPQPTIWRILKGESRDPETGTLEKLAKHYRITVAQLRGETALNQISEPTYNVDPGPDVHAINLISWVQAGKPQPVSDPHRAGEGEKPIYTSRRVGPNAYALRIRGDSMENPNGMPTFPHGCVIVVDPDKPARPGSFVVVRLEGSEEATFKQFVEDAGQKFLKPLNPRYPLLQLKEKATLCGTWVQTIIDSD